MGNAAGVKQEKCTCLPCKCVTPDCKCTDVCKTCAAAGRKRRSSKTELPSTNFKMQCKNCAPGKIELLLLRRESKKLDTELKKLKETTKQRIKQNHTEAKQDSENQTDKAKDDDSLPTLLSSLRHSEKPKENPKDSSLAPNRTFGKQADSGKGSGPLPTLLASRNSQTIGSTDASESGSSCRKQYAASKSKTVPVLDDGSTEDYDVQVASGSVLVFGGMKFSRKIGTPTAKFGPKSSSDARTTTTSSVRTSNDRRAAFGKSKSKSMPSEETSYDRRAMFAKQRSTSLPTLEKIQLHAGTQPVYHANAYNSIGGNVKRKRNVVKQDSRVRSTSIIGRCSSFVDQLHFPSPAQLLNLRH